MFDFAKSRLKGISLINLINNPYFDFVSSINNTTGEILNVKRGTYNGMTFIIKKDEHINLNGSFHKYHNSGKHNHNDFSISQFVEVLKDLSEKFNINPFLSHLHNLEFGINIELPFDARTFLNAIILYKTKEYERRDYNGRGKMVRFSFQHYDLKIYDKGAQNKAANKNILRFEIKVKRMEYFKKRNIKILTLSDLLNQTTLVRLGDLLMKSFNELLIYDETIDIKQLKKREREVLTTGSNPKYWSRLIKNSPGNFQKKRQTFRKLVLLNSKMNMQKIVFDLIENKIKEVLLFDGEAERKINNYFSSISNKILPKVTDKVLPKVTNLEKIDFTESNTSNSRLKAKVFKRQKLIDKNSKAKSENWETEILELDHFFKNVIMPVRPVKLNSHSTITNITLFIHSHFATVRANKGCQTYLPYLDRLQQLKTILE